MVKNETFIATTEGGILSILIFSPEKNKVVISKKIQLDDPLGSASTNSSGVNNSVQYNSKTHEIFFSTTGYSEYDGSCINKDGTCTSRLYKISLGQTKPTLIFESNTPPSNWIVNSFDNSLLLSFLKNKTQIIKKINSMDGKVIFSKEHEIDGTLAEFVFSRDGQYTYQARKKSVNGWFNEILWLRKIDNSNGEVSEQEIFDGERIEAGTSISPDDNYLAFYSGIQGSEKLYIYEIPTKKLTYIPYHGVVANLNLIWSGDSKKLLQLLKESIVYYDISTLKSTIVSDILPQKNYVYAWAPSTNYFLYKSQIGGIKIFDVQKKQIIDTPIKEKSEVKGIGWY